jgi:putative membrane protein
MMHYWYYSPSYTGFGFGWIFIVLWWILVAWLIVAVVRFLFGSRRHWHDQTPENDSDEALKILKSRYARGDISKKEFDAIKKDIA